MNRRNLLRTGFTLAGGSLLASTASAQKAIQETPEKKFLANTAPGRRKLGKLEVSSIGMGVQNMHRKHNTLVPYRPEMVEILRAAYDRGITFFDCAEAYGPFENDEAAFAGYPCQSCNVKRYWLQQQNKNPLRAFIRQQSNHRLQSKVAHHF